MKTRKNTPDPRRISSKIKFPDWNSNLLERPETEPQWMTSTQVTQWMGISIATLKRYRKHKYFPTFYFKGNVYFLRFQLEMAILLNPLIKFNPKSKLLCTLDLQRSEIAQKEMESITIKTKQNGKTKSKI